MKANFLITLLAMLFSMIAVAQSPDLLNYQAVLRNTDGTITMNQAISVDFIIHGGSATGPTVYAETHSATTNEYGLVSLQIGGGTTSSGSFADIDWSDGSFFLEVEVDGSPLGTQQMASVPYSLYAIRAGSADNDGDTDPTNEIQTLELNGDQLSLSNGGSVTLPQSGSMDWEATANNISNTNTGNVGIGTTTPDRKLTVETDAPLGLVATISNLSSDGFAGTIYRAGGVNKGYIGYAGSGGWLAPDAFQIGTVDDTDFKLLQNSSIRMTVKSNNGDIGIGTEDPKYDFHLSNGAISGLNIGAGNGMVITSPDLPRFYFEDASGEENKKVLFQEYRNGKYKISATNDAGTAFVNENLFVVNSDGNVGVGLSDPAYKFVVEHTTHGLQIKRVNNASYWEIYQQNAFEGDLQLWNTNLNVGEFNYSSGSYSSTSDRALKRNINPLSAVLPSLMQLEASSYFYASDEEQKRNIGFIAQDVEKLFPELVTPPSDEPGRESNYLMNYSGFGVLAVKAIQEQQAVIEAQQAEIDAIKKALAEAGISLD